ncbi:hypothetical protein Tco_1473488 [Tanacetum coccineum]
MSVNRIDVIDVACEEYAQEVLGFSNNSMGGNPTPTSEPIISDSSLSLTPFEGSDLILEEIEAYLKDDSISPKIDHADFDLDGDLRLTEELLNNDPSSPLPLSHNTLSSSTTFSSRSLTSVETNILLLKKFLNDDPSSPLPPKEFNFEKLKMIKSSIDDFSSVNVYEEKSVTFSNPLFDSNDDFTSSDDESLFDEDVPEDNVKIYSNPLFAYDDEYISSDVNPLFDEVLEDIESKDSYVSILDEPALLVTPLSGVNEDECFDLGGVIDEIDAFLDMDISTDIKNEDHDSEGDIIYLESFLIDDTIPNLPPGVFLDHDPRSLKDEHDNDDLMTKDKSGIEVDRAKVDVIAKLPHPTTVKGVRSFLGHAGFYRRFIQDFSKIARPMTHLLEKETPFVFSKECIDAFETLKKKLTEAPILVLSPIGTYLSTYVS